jgi:hypothetical protein
MTNPDSDQFNAEVVVGTHWPYNFTQNRLNAALSTNDELLRWACHGLINGESRAKMLPYASDVMRVVNAFNSTLHKMEQVLDYTSAELSRRATAGDIYHHDIAPRDRWEPESVEFARGKVARAELAISKARNLMRAAAHELATAGTGAFGVLDPADRPEQAETPRALRAVPTPEGE